jgi:general stress protein YciG
MEQELTKPKMRKGFACMSPERQREIARMGGKALAPEKRSFSQSRALAMSAGSKGGKATGPSKARHGTGRGR